jgi:hypothetical protein
LTALAPARTRIVDLIEKTCADQARLHHDVYGFFRPQVIPASYVPGMKLVLDCSDYCRFICRAADVKDDPAGNGYADFGNSSSIWVHLHHIDLADALPGDIVVFGFWTGEKHACILHSKDPKTGQWKVGNFGGPGQPIIDWLSQEISYHRGMTMTVCRINVPVPPPTPQDKLRAMTGFYSWVAWALGEGPFRNYGKKNPTVRPAVPKRISAGWWVRYAQFLKNRKKPTPSSV